MSIFVATCLITPSLYIQPAGAGPLDEFLRPSCDPSLQQSCIPGSKTIQPTVPGSLTGLPFPPPERYGSCGPGYAGAPSCGNGPATLGNQSRTNQGGGNPINLITGNKYQREDDLPALPGVLGLEIVRHYNSAYSNSNNTTGLLGRGWKLSYETDLYAVGNTIQIIQADGTRIIFNRDASNRSLCSTSNPADGTLRIDTTRGGDEYVWHWANGRVLSFNNLGKLVQIAEPTGEFVSLQHDRKGLLMQVTDPQGRQLRLHYPGPGDIVGSDTVKNGFRGMMAIDTPVGRFEYAYGSVLPAGATAAKSSVLANLVKVDYPHQGGSRVYHYEDARRPTYLTGISVVESGFDDHAGILANKPTITPATVQPRRIGTYLYDIDGRAILTVRGEPARLQLDSRGKPLAPARLQTGTGLNQLTIDYATPGRTVVRNGLGQTTIYQHAIIDNQYRLTSVRGAGCRDCGNSDIRYRYDKSARLIETTRLNPAGEPIEAIQSELDNIGRIVRQGTTAYVAGKPQPAKWHTTYAYPAPGVVVVSRPSMIPGREHQTRTTTNANGQLLGTEETGWSPGSDNNDAPLAITRATTYRYQTINGRSVLAEIDGPLANGAGNNPNDSDITRMTWDARGSFVTQITQPGTAGKPTQQITYNQAGQVASVRNVQGQASRFTYHWLGMLQSATQLDVQGNIVKQYSVIHDTMGRAIEYGSGTLGTPSYRAEQRRAFDAANQLLWQAQANGILRQASYDPESHLKRVIVDGFGQRQQERYDYDEQGRVMQVNDGSAIVLPPATAPATATPAGTGASTGTSTTNVLRDDFGREVIITIGQGRMVQSYDAADRRISQIDEKGVRTTLRYDVQGHMIERRVQDATAPSPAAIVTDWHYAAGQAGRLAEVHYPGQTERFTYDADGRQVSRTVEMPMQGAPTQNAHATKAPIASSVPSNISITTRTRYQADGSVESQTLPDGSWLHYERNSQGQIVALSRQASTWSFGHGSRSTLVSGLQRDLVGLTQATYGNGIEANWQRSAEGAVLARVVYTTPNAKADPTLMPPQGAVANKPIPTSTPLSASLAPLPGALSLPTDPSALFDARLLYDTAGNVLLQHQSGTGMQRTQAYAYDGWHQLIAAHRSNNASQTNQAARSDQVWRYAYDINANRVLAQEDVAPGEMGQTQYVRYDVNDEVLGKTAGNATQAMSAKANTNVSATANTTAPLTYIRNTTGQLQRIEQSGQELARYAYDASGLHVSKVTKAGTTYYLYDQQRQRSADLDAQGRIVRQYVWVDGKLLATIDPATPRQTDATADGAMAQGLQNAQALWRSLLGQNDRITYIHANYLGAPIAATNAKGQTVWQADYAPFGKLIQEGSQQSTQANTAPHAYQLDLRLPGQWDDAESGLYYNDARYYDPGAGRYLSADPLGHMAERMGSTNAFAYVNNNPTSYVDPLGLILFAFDGTGNGEYMNDPAMRGNGFSNIRRFVNAYDDGRARYVSGVGTVHVDGEYGNIVPDDYAKNTRLYLLTPGTPVFYNDMGGNYSGPARIDRMVKYIEAEATAAVDKDMMQIDIIGFSRGAAQAREFANRIVSQTTNSAFRYIGTDGKPKCQLVNFRFMGLFDTVLSTNYSNLKTYRLGIPSEFAHVSQAVALNEYRSDDGRSWIRRNPQPFEQHFGAFPLESIGVSSTIAGKIRVERGFIGAHADIGGGYAESEGQLSLVALNWMLRQAQDAGVKLKPTPPLQINNPILHDQSTAIRINRPDVFETVKANGRDYVITAEDRVVKGAISGQTQRTMGFNNNSMRYADTQKYIAYTGRNIDQRNVDQNNPGSNIAPKKLGNQTGFVDIGGYLDWLRQHDYCFIGDMGNNCK